MNPDPGGPWGLKPGIWDAAAGRDYILHGLPPGLSCVDCLDAPEYLPAGSSHWSDTLGSSFSTSVLRHPYNFWQ